MKKIIVKKKVIDIPYAPAIPERAEYWVKDFDVSYTEPADLEGWSHIPTVPAIPEQKEVSHLEVDRESQSTDEELERMLSMEAPDAIIEVVDITVEHAKKEKEKKDKKDKHAADSASILSTDFSKTLTTKELTELCKKLIETLKSIGIL